MGLVRVVAFDLALNATGFALPGGYVYVHRPPAALPSIGKIDFTAGALLSAVEVAPPDVVILEGYAQHSPGRLSLIRSAELGGTIRLGLYRLGIPYAEVPPSALKRWATGSGSADKTAMIDAAKATHPRPETVEDDNAADAWHLWRAGMAWYAGEHDPHGRRPMLRHAADWPTLGGRRP